MIPEHRLAALLDEVKDGWISNCLYHNTADSPSLYVDHNCERDDFPMKPVLELKGHHDEVWYLKYSNDGKKLASTSKDKTVVIYDTTTYKILHQLDEHDSGVTHLAWSPDDTKIITCCAQQENSARIWDVEVCTRCPKRAAETRSGVFFCPSPQLNFTVNKNKSQSLPTTTFLMLHRQRAVYAPTKDTSCLPCRLLALGFSLRFWAAY